MWPCLYEIQRFDFIVLSSTTTASVRNVHQRPWRPPTQRTTQPLPPLPRPPTPHGYHHRHHCRGDRLDVWAGATHGMFLHTIYYYILLIILFFLTRLHMASLYAYGYHQGGLTTTPSQRQQRLTMTMPTSGSSWPSHSTTWQPWRQRHSTTIGARDMTSLEP